MLVDPLSVACPWCLVDAGARCVNTSGKPRHVAGDGSHHVRRLRAQFGDAATAVITKILKEQEASVAGKKAAEE